MASDSFRPTRQFILDVGQIFAVPDSVRAEFIESLKKYTTGSDLTDYIFEATRCFDGYEDVSVAAVFSAVRGLLAYRSGANNLEINRHVENILDGLKRSKADFIRSEDKVAEIRKFFVDLYSVGKLASAAKAVVLGADHNLVLTASRIITDIRPIFENSVFDDPERSVIDGYLVCHQLRISVEDVRGQRDIYATISGEHLASLRDAIDRAEKKASILKNKFNGILGDNYTQGGV